MVDEHSPGAFQIAKETRYQPREFNIFSILDVTREENHARFLSFLLNPSMPHNQKGKILSSFLRLPSLRFDSEELTNIEEWRVEPEKWITIGTASLSKWKKAKRKRLIRIKGKKRHFRQRRVDILISSPTKKHMVIIEAKIKTDDVEDQLRDYYDWLLRQAPTEGEKGRRILVYLTPEGREAKYFPFPDTTSNNESYSLMSFCHDISTCLNQSVRIEDKSFFAQCLVQYCTSLEEMLEQLGTDEKDTALENPEKGDRELRVVELPLCPRCGEAPAERYALGKRFCERCKDIVLDESRRKFGFSHRKTRDNE